MIDLTKRIWYITIIKIVMIHNHSKKQTFFKNKRVYLKQRGKKMSRRLLIENYITLLPMLYRTLFRDFPNCGVTKLQMKLLYYLKIEGGKPMNYYAKKIMVSKPNMSVLAEKMINEGFIEKGTFEGDKRVTTLKLTKMGGNFLDAEMNKFINHLLDKLSVFEDKEIERLNEMIEEITDMFSKVRNDN